MLKSALTTKQDLIESLKLQRRRRLEEERMKRFFDARQRVFGVDVPGIERQLADKKKQRDIKAECDRLWDQQNESQQYIVNSKAVEIEKRKKVMAADLRYYRCRFQKFEDRREFDINDPDIKKISQPVRVADDDIRLGVSSAQILPGEDIYSNERKLEQRAQTRSWIRQQKQETKQAKESRQRADEIFRQNTMSREQRLEEMERDQKEMKHQIIMNTRDYNLEMARQKRLEREKAKLETANDDLAEIYNMMTSDMLTQNRENAESKTNPNKKIAYIYRGMTDSEMTKFREDQALQRVTNLKEREHNLFMDQQWGQYVMNMNRDLLLKEADLEDKRAAHLEKHINFNKELAVKQREQKEKLNDLMKRNHLTLEYFNQFNKSSR